jgi:mannose-6-phosphate isomerase-like protein (cupin superfamily)
VEVDLRRLLGPAPEGPDRRGRVALDEPVDLAQKLSTFDEHFQPRIVGYYNDNKIQVGKIKGEFVWHSHPETDDFFLVLKGRLTIKLRDGDVELGEGDLFVVPRGAEHCPVAHEEAHILLIEPLGTPNTGDSGAQAAPEREI